MRSSEFKIDIEKLYALAERQNEVLALEEELFQFKRLLERNFEVKLFFEDIGISAKLKKEAIKEIFLAASSVFYALIEFLIDEDRLSRVIKISEKYSRLVGSKGQIKFAEVLSIEPLPFEAMEALKAKLGKVSLKNTIDSSLMAGIVVRMMGGEVIDASLRGRVNQLRERMTYAS